jgi:hypothetical protein
MATMILTFGLVMLMPVMAVKGSYPRGNGKIAFHG